MGRKHKNRKKREKRNRIRHEKKHPTETSNFQGIISVAPGGFGFVSPPDKSSDVFIPPKYINSAMSGDKVEVEAIIEKNGQRDPSKGPVGKITQIISRGRNKVVGQLISGHKLKPISKKIPDELNVSGSLNGAKRGDWVEADLLFNEEQGEAKNCAVKSNLGHAGCIENDLNAIIKEYDLVPPYTEEQEKAASELKPREIERVDLSHLFCATIDPKDAKDYDDAISYAEGKNENEVELGIHIADVASWIEPGSTFDKQAHKRGFTSYLPGKTLPMLPRNLTKLISLGPDKLSPAHTVIITIDKEVGKILKAKRFHSNIKITKRLSFDEVQSFIDGKCPEEWDNSFAENMQKLIDLTRTMRKYRKKTEKFLELSTTEIRIIIDEETKAIEELQHRTQREADQVVEECMLAANSEVAKEMIEKSCPAIYRVHPEPFPEKLEEFSQFIYGTFGEYPGDLSSREACNHFLASLPDDHRKPIMISAFLRAMPRAYYFEEAALHFGLGKGRYCHFTSPIRRYPDLIVHQQLWEKDTGGNLHSKKLMTKFAADSSQKEENNDEAYYAAVDRLKLQYLNSQLESTDEEIFHEGLIAKINSYGLLVDIPELGIYGFVDRDSLPGKYRFSKRFSKLTALNGHQQYKCGDYIYLKLDRIDLIKGSAIFRPVL